MTVFDLTEPALSAANLVQVQDASPIPKTDAPPPQTGVFVTVHGHFYQPPRENPYLDAIECQPSAFPFHDWNERIYHECYRPNAFARILNDQGQIIGLVNNFEYLSFNIGPTLLSWLERYDPEVYQRILEADRKSCQRLNGHGNAIAQAYNHIILPLANERDKYTQIRWGKADFRARFGRDPEGMWLAEAAVDYPTLAVLVAEGIKFIVLAPSQAQRCRPLMEVDGSPAWQEVGGGQIDPTQPYRCFLPGGQSQYDFIDIFFYDGPISRDAGFSELLNSSQQLAARLGLAVRGDHRQTQLIAMATDGETFGHHKKGTEKALAYAFVTEFPQRGWTISNFAHYLSLHPPTWEVELKPVTAWSCAHGVDRWQENCGCGGEGSLWHQRWRRPLRDALDWLRDQLQAVYIQSAEPLLLDPWQARDEYIAVILERGLAVGGASIAPPDPISESCLDIFLLRHQHHPLNELERVDVLRLLEMQRHSLLMYTSCGWFFEEISRPEGVQILRYAARALELAGEVTGIQLEAEFIQRLSTAASNVAEFQDGAGIYRQLVKPSQLGLQQVAAHYAISSLFTSYPLQQRIFCYQAQQLDYQLQRMGSLTLAVGQLQLSSEITAESAQLVFAVLHLGGWDFHCCIQAFSGRRHYSDLKAHLFSILQGGSAARTVLGMGQHFGETCYGLNDLFAEERHRIMGLLSQETLTRLEQLYTQVYRDNYGILIGFRRDGLPVPQELQVAAQIALSHRAIAALKGLELEMSDPSQLGTQSGSQSGSQWGYSYLAELVAIAAEANHLGCQLNLGQGQLLLTQLIQGLLWHLLHDLNGSENLDLCCQRLSDLLEVGHLFALPLKLEKAQELYYQYLHQRLIPQYWPQPPASSVEHLPENALTRSQLRQLLSLGKRLGVEVSPWLSSLS
jgi:alpha-amylase/alpha-mannosidase (GH57 family)